MTDMDFSALEFSDNADSRCPVIIVLDASSSMLQARPGETQTPMEALNSGLDTLISELNKDPLAKRRVELSVVVFGTEVSPATPFATVDKAVLPTLVDSGVTSMGKAVEVALDAVEERKKTYKANGVSYYKSWLLLITDGLPTDSIANAVERIKKAEDNNAVSMFAVGVEGADMGVLAQLSPARSPLELKGLNFNELFVWLSASQSAVSASNPGDSVALPSPAGWASI